MSTPYDNIHNRVLIKISDRDLLSLLPADLEEYLDNLLRSALVKFRTNNVDLSDRNDGAREFNTTLSEIEEEILALFEVVEWLTPQIKSIDILKQNLSTKDYKLASQANHLDKLQALYRESQITAERLRIDYNFRTTSLDDLLWLLNMD